MPRRKRRNRTRRLIGWSLLVVLLGYLVVLPAVQAVWESHQVRPSMRTLEEMTVAQTMQLRAVEVFTTFWFLAFRRLLGQLSERRGRPLAPRRESVRRFALSLLPRQNSLAQQRADRRLAVAGRPLPHLPAADCAALSAGGNSGRSHLRDTGVRRTAVRRREPARWLALPALPRLRVDHLLYQVGHGPAVRLPCDSVVRLLAAALMRWDGLRIPRRFVLICAGLGLLIPAIWPDVHPVLWNGAEPRLNITGSPAWWTRFDTSVIGLLAGTVWGALLGLTAPRGRVGSPPRRPMAEAAFCLGLTGLVLGWQAALSVSLLAAVVALAVALIAAGWKLERTPPLASLFLAAAVLQILLWRWLSSIPFWPGHAAGANSVIVSCAAAVGLFLCAGRLRDRNPAVGTASMAEAPGGVT